MNNLIIDNNRVTVLEKLRGLRGFEGDAKSFWGTYLDTLNQFLNAESCFLLKKKTPVHGR
jgi:hypothetical protein